MRIHPRFNTGYTRIDLKSLRLIKMQHPKFRHGKNSRHFNPQSPHLSVLIHQIFKCFTLHHPQRLYFATPTTDSTINTVFLSTIKLSLLNAHSC